MPCHCAIVTCKNRGKLNGGKTIMYKRGDRFQPRNSYICSEHFDSDDYIRDLKAELLGLPPKLKLNTTLNQIYYYRMTFCLVPRTMKEQSTESSLPDGLILSPDAVVAITSLYFATSIIWFGSSVLLLLDFLKSKFRRPVLIVWVVVTAIISAIDFAATVSFGVEYGNFLKYNAVVSALIVPGILMTLSARGFVLWIMNVALVVYLSRAAGKLKKTSTETMVFPPFQRRVSLGSLYSSKATDSYDRGRQNPTFQPDPVAAWNIQSPTVGEMKRSPWDFPENTSPRVASNNMNMVSNKVLPRIGRPVSTPIAPVAPLPIPQPDYSPPLGRPVKHEPNLLDSPLRSALKKPSNQLGRTIL